MSHEDLERRLRSESSHHDGGYHPVPLPRSLESSVARPRVGRLALVTGTVVAGVAAAVVLIALFGAAGGQPIGEAPVASPIPTMTPAGSTVCTVAEVAVTAEPWGGAAGSRGTTLTVALAGGARPCELPAQVEVRMATGDGQSLVAGLSGGAIDATLPLDGRTAYALGVAWSNWCGEQPDGAHLELRLGASDGWIAVETPPQGADPVPPCLGSGQATSLSLSQLEARAAP